MPEEKEKLMQIGLDDLGRFSIGQESNTLYFDGLKVQDPVAKAGDEKLKAEIAEIVREVVEPRFVNIEILLTKILNRLSPAGREISSAAKPEPKSWRTVYDFVTLLGKARKELSLLQQEIAEARKSKGKTVRRYAVSKK
jgi:hypothetical protein